MSSSFEKDIDDRVYEDDYYEAGIEEEPFVKEEEEQKNIDESGGRAVFLVCDECDNRWEDFISDDDESSKELYCPLCGSQNITIM